MGKFLAASLLLAAAAAPVVFAAELQCGNGVLCPQNTPCCSQYGQCGVGAYCLGGCDPVNSFSLNSCTPEPVCKSASYDFSNLNNVQANTKYLGDASKADWVSSGEPVEYSGSLLLTMAQGTVGTLMASTHYVWYGKVGARMKTSAGAGVVTAFILLSDTKDEIDFEFVGVDLMTAQTNFYSQGVTNYNNGMNTSIPSDSMSNYHDYEIDWKPDTLTWSIDGKVVRTLNKADTWNATANRYSYPQTPARVQLSLWPAGLPTNPQGTINWAGGQISWNSPYMTNGYYYSQFDSVNIQCYSPPSGANVQGSQSYIYTDRSATNNTVETTNNPTVLGSFLATGLNMGYGNSSGTNSQASTATTVNSIPGQSGVAPGSNNYAGDSSSAVSQASTRTASAGSAATGGFVQGSGSSGATAVKAENVVSGSLFAIVIAFIGLCVL